MKMFRISILGLEPSGGFFQTRAEAEREVGHLKREDRASAELVLLNSGIIYDVTNYEIHEVEL